MRRRVIDESKPMTYRDKIPSATAQASSREESIAILDRYRDDLSEEEYGWIYSSIATHAIERMYLGELEIVMGIAQIRGEITRDDVLKIVKAIGTDYEQEVLEDIAKIPEASGMLTEGKVPRPEERSY